MLKKLVFLLYIIIPCQLFAQNNTLTGNIFDNDNRSTALQGATVKNLSTNAFTLTDKDGHFAINAKIGDLVSFALAGFQTDTVYLTKLFPKNVYLRYIVNNLQAVDINGAKVSPMLGNVGNPDNKPAARAVDYSKDRGGVRLSLGFGKYRKEQLKIQELEEYDRYQTEINKNFSEEFIKAVVKFEGPGIRDFIDMYRPTVEQVKAERPFNYQYYTANAYQAWLKLPVSQRKLPSLTKPKAGN